MLEILGLKIIEETKHIGGRRHKPLLARCYINLCRFFCLETVSFNHSLFRIITKSFEVVATRIKIRLIALSINTFIENMNPLHLLL